MSMDAKASPRRSFLSGLGAAFAAVGLGSGRASAQSGFTPASHKEDAWLSQLPGTHRIVIDAVMPPSAVAGILYASNLLSTNKSAYGGADRDLAIVVVMRHFATPFAFNDAIWAKYGKALGAMLDVKDPKTKQAPDKNIYSYNYGLETTALGNTIKAVTDRGVVVAVCDLATHFTASQLAKPMEMTADAIYSDFKANMLPNSRFVSAGVNAVTRAQELGYALIYAG